MIIADIATSIGQCITSVVYCVGHVHRARVAGYVTSVRHLVITGVFRRPVFLVDLASTTRDQMCVCGRGGYCSYTEKR